VFLYREWLVFCRHCGERTRKDNMARHCGEIHGSHALYLRKKDGNPAHPCRLDWKIKLINPGSIWMRVPTQHQESDSDGGDSCQIKEDQASDRSPQQHPDIGKGGSTRQGNRDQAGVETDSRSTSSKPIRLEHHGPIGVDIVKHQPRFGGYGPPDDVIKAKYHRSSVNPDSQRLSVTAES
jgi:hypothetical protein